MNINAQPVDLNQRRRRFHFIKASEFEPRPINWLISDFLEHGSLVQYFGDPEAAKTFFILDQVASVCSGQDWHGHKTKQGLVLYVCGEGANGVARRKRALEIRREIDFAEYELYFSTIPVSMTEREALAELMQAIEEVGNPDLVILDTLARNFGPGDENSSKDMTEFVAACDEIKNAYGCTIVIIHHSGHADKDRARGSTVLRGALDAEYRLKKEPDGTVVLTCTKAKDFRPPDPMAFKFRTVELDFLNDDGSPATSAVLEPCAVPAGGGKRMGGSQRQALDVLDELYRENGARLEAGGHDPTQANIRLDDWRTACIDAGIPRRSFYNIKESLMGRNQISTDIGGFVRREENV